MSGWDNVFTALQSLPLRTCQLRGYLGGEYEAESVNIFVLMSSNRYDIRLERYPKLSLLLEYCSKDGLEPPCLSTLVEVPIKDPREHSELSTLTASRLWEIMMYQVKFRYDYPSDSDYTISSPDPSAEFDVDDVTG